MNTPIGRDGLVRGLGLACALWLALQATVEAGGHGRAPRPTTSVVVPTQVRVVPTQAQCAPTPVAQPPRQLGTFYPQPYMTVLGTGMAGGGYSPLDMYGNVSLSEYGPLSAFRRVAAPVNFYSRGYDGRVQPMSGVTFSYPNMPPASNVIYPTRANYHNSFPTSGTPPFWDSSLNWIDQN